MEIDRTNKTEKGKTYVKPQVERISIDAEVSILMMSPPTPGWASSSHSGSENATNVFKLLHD